MCDINSLYSWGLKDITLRPYQVEGVNWFLKCIENSHGGILSDEMGLGKTIQTISAILSFKKLKAMNKFIIICPLSVIDNWKIEITKYTTSLKFITYTGIQQYRQNLRESELWKSNQIVIITTYEFVIQDSTHINEHSFDALFMDEGHRIKNHESVLYKIVADMSIPLKFLLTGTPIQNNLDEFYNVLHIVSPHNRLLQSRNGFKKYIESRLSEPAAQSTFGTILESCSELKSLIMRRTKAEVLKCLPEKKEILLFHSLTELQKKMYKSFLMKDSKVLQQVLTKKGTTNTEYKKLMNILMQVRKCVLHPYLFPGIEEEPFKLGEHLINVSHKMMVFDKLLQYLLKRNHKILIFSQMTKMLDIIQDYCTLRKYNYERLDGSVRSEERFSAITNFSTNSDTRLFLLSTRAGGQGLNLTAADTVIFLDSDFNPQVDLQAMARIHRPGQTRPCRTIRLVAKNSVEEMIVYRAHQKLQMTRGILGHEDGDDKKDSSLTNVKQMLCYGLDKLFSDAATPNDIENETNKYASDSFLTSILGDTDSRGHWQTPVDEKEDMSLNNENIDEMDHIYLFDGQDFASMKCKKKKDYDKVLKILNIDETINENKNKPVDDEDSNKLHKHLNSGRKVVVNRKEERKKQLWQANKYESHCIDIDTNIMNRDVKDDVSLSSSFDGESDANHSIQYVSGSVLQPQSKPDCLSIVCHLVDDSGSWGSGGLFSSIDQINSQISLQYMTAFEMEDLQLGDIHIFSLTTNIELALMIGQSRDKNDRIKPINMNNIEKCLDSLAVYASNKQASVHMPRIGYNTPQFNWYGMERLITKQLVERGVETYVYYYRRRHNNVRNQNQQRVDKDEPLKRRKLNNESCEENYKKLSEEYFDTILEDYCIWFHDSIMEQEKANLTRNIYALGGEVSELQIDSETTHVVYNEEFYKLDKKSQDSPLVWIELNLFRKYINNQNYSNN